MHHQTALLWETSNVRMAKQYVSCYGGDHCQGQGKTNGFDIRSITFHQIMSHHVVSLLHDITNHKNKHNIHIILLKQHCSNSRQLMLLVIFLLALHRCKVALSLFHISEAPLAAVVARKTLQRPETIHTTTSQCLMP